MQPCYVGWILPAYLISLRFVCSMLHGLIRSGPKYSRVKLSHIFRAGLPGFLQAELFWTTVMHSHNTA